MIKEEYKMDFSDFEPLFGKWAERFKPFIESKEMFEIYKRIKSDAFTEDGKRKEIICPSNENVFRAFKTTDPAEIKTIWYLMDPYPKRYKGGALQATGIAMDCSNSPDKSIQPSLSKFYEGMSKDLDKEVEKSLSLEYLHEQGVMFLNTDLTCKLNKTASHEGLWEPFQKYFLEEIMRGYTGIIYVLAGKASHRMERYINPLGNHIFKIDHPVSASYKNTEWDCKKIFSLTNKIISQNNGKHFEIIWNKKDYDIQKLPF